MNVRVGSENCRLRPDNVLEMAVVLPHQRPGEFEQKAGVTGVGSKEWLTLKFSEDGKEILKDGSFFQRRYEGKLGVSGKKHVDYEAEMRRAQEGGAIS